MTGQHTNERIPATRQLTSALLRRGLRHAPTPLFNHLLAEGSNRLLKTQLEQGELDFLRGQCWEITLTDVPLTFYLSLDNRRLRVSRKPQAPDVAFRGPVDSFLLLTLQWEDPDSLFFNRRLMVTGDTELGLEIKNFMHGIEATEILPEPVYRILAALCRTLTSDSMMPAEDPQNRTREGGRHASF